MRPCWRILSTCSCSAKVRAGATSRAKLRAKYSWDPEVEDVEAADPPYLEASVKKELLENANGELERLEAEYDAIHADRYIPY